MKFFKKFWYLFLILFLIILGVVIFLLFGLGKKNTSSNYYYYVRDNSVILWNKKTNEKYTLSENYGDDSDNGYDYYAKLSKDDKKVVYTDNNYDGVFSISYVELSSLIDSKKLDEKHLIAKDATKFDVVEGGVAYLKNNNLYFYNYDITEKIKSSVEDFYIGDDGSSIYYIDEDKKLYKITPSKDEKEEVKSEIDSAISICENTYYATETGNDYTFNLYVNGNLLSKDVNYFYPGFCGESYFVAYTSPPKNEDDKNINIATYHSKDGKKEKIADGFVFGEGEEYFKGDFYIYAEYENKNEYFVNVLDTKKNKITKVPITSDVNLGGFNYRNGNIFYEDTDGDYYYLKYNNGDFEKKVHLGKEICRNAWKDDELYFVESCDTEKSTGTIYLYKDGKFKEITRDGYDILNVNDKIYYSTYDGNTKEFYSYDKNELLSDNYLYAFSYNDVLYYAQDEYESGKDGNLYATVYYVDSDNKSQLVDNDVLEGVIQELK